MSLSLSSEQKQILSSQMIQSIEILQMGTQELLEHLQNAVQENPVLELQEQHDKVDMATDFSHQLEWLESSDPQNRDYYRQDYQDNIPFINNYADETATESLCDHLLAQLGKMQLPLDVAMAARFLTGCLDDKGYLCEELSVLAPESGWDEKTLECALLTVQSLDPAGIGARGLSECLHLQLLRHIPVNELAVRIVDCHLEDLARNHYGAIARALNIEQSEIYQACQAIRTLDPRPGSRFSIPDHPGYIIPDIIVVHEGDYFEPLFNEQSLPTLNISTYYTQLLKESNDTQVKDYLTKKVGHAKWMIQAVEQRKQTLVTCSKGIVELQNDFFRRGPGHLRPLSLTDVARWAGIHPSTVSRATKEKYLQCAKGTYPLNYFFSRRLGPTDTHSSPSADQAKALLKALIDREDKGKPLSDQKLCEHMAKEGYILSRRTVAKYRDELGIPGASGRKEF